MRKRFLLRPQLETMEALTLLSTVPVNPHLASAPGVPASDIVATPFEKVSLSGGQVNGAARIEPLRAHSNYWTVPIEVSSNELAGARFASLDHARVMMSFRYKVSGNPKRQAFPSQADPIQFASGTATIERFDKHGKRMAGTIGLEILLSSTDSPRTSQRYLYKVIKATGPFDGTKGVVGMLTFSQLLPQFPYDSRIAINNLTATFK